MAAVVVGMGGGGKSPKVVLKSVNVFAFTNKLKLVMKGNELELTIAFLTTCNFFTVQSNR